MSYTLEICVDSVASAVNAEKGGATRLELCENLVIGGTTPSPAFFRQVRQAVSIPIHVLVRARFGDFLYTEEELERMANEIKDLAEEGAECFVIGALTEIGDLDVPGLSKMMQSAPKAAWVLHRAFDMCKNRAEVLEAAIDLGFRGILTSGGEGTATEGMEELKKLVSLADGRLEIIVGAGVNSKNIEHLLSTGATAYHLSAKTALPSAMQYRNDKVYMGLPGLSEYEIYQTSAEEVALCRSVLERRKP